MVIIGESPIEGLQLDPMPFASMHHCVIIGESPIEGLQLEGTNMREELK